MQWSRQSVPARALARSVHVPPFEGQRGVRRGCSAPVEEENHARIIVERQEEVVDLRGARFKKAAQSGGDEESKPILTKRKREQQHTQTSQMSKRERV